MQINEVIYAGNLGRDAELFKTQSGMEVVTLSICNTHKGKDGKEAVTWLKAKCFGAWANTAKNFKKGDNVMVKGRLQETSWEDKQTGQKRTSIELICQSVACFVKLEKDFSETKAAPKADPVMPDFSDIPF